MMPDAKLDDGRIDLAAIGPRRIWNWIGFFSRITWQNLVVRPIKLGRLMLEATSNDKTLENMSAQRIKIRPHSPALIQVDGDPQGEVVQAEFSVLPKALRMLV
jgi:diacylglycerol kinase family enzyme